MASSSENYSVGKGIVYLRRFEKLPTTWAVTTAYGPGAYVNNGDYLWTTVSGGTSSTGAGPTGATGTFVDGTVTWTAVTWTDLGNAPSFTWAAEVENLDHFSSRTGIRTRDKRVVTSRRGTLTIVLDEITKDNLAIAMMGTVTGSNVTIFETSQVDAQVKLVGTNDVGNKFQAKFGYVSFTPGREMQWIGEDWMQIELTGEVNADADGSYGLITAL